MAPLGAFSVFGLLLLLAGKPGQQGYRLIIVGLALAELLRASSDLLISLQGMTLVSGIYVWKNGSLSGQGFEISGPVLLGISLCLPFLLLLQHRIELLQFGDYTVRTLGLSLRRTQYMILVMALLLLLLDWPRGCAGLLH